MPLLKSLFAVSWVFFLISSLMSLTLLPIFFRFYHDPERSINNYGHTRGVGACTPVSFQDM
jgi:hypothetical protein